jgi:hypothetical protein
MFNLLIIKDDLFCFYIKTEQQKVKHIKDRSSARSFLRERGEAVFYLGTLRIVSKVICFHGLAESNRFRKELSEWCLPFKLGRSNGINKIYLVLPNSRIFHNYY